MAGQRRLSLTEIPDFTSLFWKAIWENIGTRLQFSSSFHPQTDGQSEIANSVVLDLLKSYISDQKTQWERFHPSLADEYTRDLDTAFAKVRETLQKSQERQKKAADRHRRDLKLKENDWVLLRFEKARLRKKKGKERLYPKLSMRYYGPFQITERINDVSFRLRLPDTWKIHNAFHVYAFGDTQFSNLLHIRDTAGQIRAQRMVVTGRPDQCLRSHAFGHHARACPRQPQVRRKAQVPPPGPTTKVGWQQASRRHTFRQRHQSTSVPAAPAPPAHASPAVSQLDVAAPGLAERIPPIVLAKLNAEKYTKIASRFDVRGYPTLKFFIHGYPVDYKGPRKAASLSSHLEKLASPEIKLLENEDELQNFLKLADDSFPFFIGFGTASSLFSDVAKEFKNKAWFLVLESFTEKTMESFDFDKSPAVVALRREKREQEIFYGPFEGDDLALFVKQNLLPRVNIMSSESLRTLREDGRPIALAILDNDSSEQSMSFIKKLKAAAPANRAFLFAYVDWRKWPSFVDSFNIDLKPGVPAFIVWNGDSTYFLSGENYDFGGERSDSYITFFLQEYKEGRAKQLNMKGPSFTDFIWSLFSMRSVYILVLIAAGFFLAQSMLSSDSAGGRTKQLHHEDYNDGLETHTSHSSHPIAEGSFNSPHGTIKED
ncbi:hypothetical protein L7F22_024468 [Adiantum nelumboides]|nr:hypothetical protein [Adiantum nelumboides]